MGLDKAEFERFWKQAGEDQSDEGVTTAWRRYNQVRAQPPPKYNDPSIDHLQAAIEPVLGKVRTSVQDTKHLFFNGRRPPWTATQLHIEAGQSVSIFATGRLWRSWPLGLWLGPQFGLWCRLGETGTVSDSTHATNTFMADRPANLYLATQVFQASSVTPENGLHDRYESMTKRMENSQL